MSKFSLLEAICAFLDQANADGRAEWAGSLTIKSPVSVTKLNCLLGFVSFMKFNKIKEP